MVVIAAGSLSLGIVAASQATMPGRSGAVFATWEGTGSNGRDRLRIVKVSAATGVVSVIKAPLSVRDVVLFSPDGRELIVRTTRGYALLDPGLRIMRSVLYGFEPETWSPDGRWVAGIGGPSNGRTDVYIARADGSGRRRITRGASAVSVSWSSRNELAVCTSQELIVGGRLEIGRILLMDPFGHHGRALYSPRRGVRWGFPFAIDWSPDARRLIFDAGTSHGHDPVYTFVVDRRGHVRNAIRFQMRQPGYATAQWSPDGRQLLFATTGALYLTAPNGTNIHLLLSGKQITTDPFELQTGEIRGVSWQPLRRRPVDSVANQYRGPAHPLRR